MIFFSFLGRRFVCVWEGTKIGWGMQAERAFFTKQKTKTADWDSIRFRGSSWKLIESRRWSRVDNEFILAQSKQSWVELDLWSWA